MSTRSGPHLTVKWRTFKQRRRQEELLHLHPPFPSAAAAPTPSAQHQLSADQWLWYEKLLALASVLQWNPFILETREPRVSCCSMPVSIVLHSASAPSARPLPDSPNPRNSPTPTPMPTPAPGWRSISQVGDISCVTKKAPMAPKMFRFLTSKSTKVHWELRVLKYKYNK